MISGYANEVALCSAGCLLVSVVIGDKPPSLLSGRVPWIIGPVFCFQFLVALDRSLFW